MTVVVGIQCEDHVIIAADSSATMMQGNTATIEQPTRKIYMIEDSVIVAGISQVGHTQQLVALAQEFWKHNVIQKADCPIKLGENFSDGLIKRFRKTHPVRLAQQLGYEAIVAYPINNKPYLCEFWGGGSLLRSELVKDDLWFVCMGSGQAITDTFLAFLQNVFWHDSQPTFAEGLFAVTWAIQTAIGLNPGGIKEPIDIAVLGPNTNPKKSEKVLARILNPSEIKEHSDIIEEAKDHFRLFKKKFSDTTEAPDIPKPPQ